MHKCEGPNNYSTTSKDELIKFYKQMSTIRRIEVVADNLYKQRLVRGFLHLYNGQVIFWTIIKKFRKQLSLDTKQT
jgi:pyruvate dehydrogenase E1 component alpha subunit